MVRRIQKLSSTALVADVFILLGIIYIFGNEIAAINTRGLADVALFNSKNYPLLVGTAVFSFEGIGLVIPVTEAMKEPTKFPKVLSGVMVGVMILFAGAGVLAYAAYGSDIQTVVIVNLPQDSRFVNVVQVLYSIAIGLSIPLQFYPAVQILEQRTFGRKSGKKDAKVRHLRSRIDARRSNGRRTRSEQRSSRRAVCSHGQARPISTSSSRSSARSPACRSASATRPRCTTRSPRSARSGLPISSCSSSASARPFSRRHRPSRCFCRATTREDRRKWASARCPRDAQLDQSSHRSSVDRSLVSPVIFSVRLDNQ